MTDASKSLINAWAKDLVRPVSIGLAADNSQAGRRLATFARVLAEKSPLVRLEKEPEKALWQPALIIGPHANIYFQALPAPAVLSEFLAAVSGNGRSQLDPASRDLLAKLETPLLIKLYTGPGCPFCPQMVSRLLKLAVASRLVSLAVVDGALCAAQAAADGIRSVPTTILDDSFRWTGLVEVREILNLAATRDPAQMSPACLRQLLEDGQAGRAAAMMSACGKIFPALLELLTHKLWSVRLGAMVVVEYLADDQPGLAAGMAGDLWQKYQTSDRQVKGDILYMLGILASAEARDYIRQALDAAKDNQIREAALDALEAIKVRNA